MLLLLLRLPLSRRVRALPGLDRLGEAERDMLVDIVDTDVEVDDETDLRRLRIPTGGSFSSTARFRLRSCSAFASCSSAMPLLQLISTHCLRTVGHILPY